MPDLAGNPLTVTGIAPGTEGGAYAGVEVSNDRGGTWHPANGHDLSSYTSAPAAGARSNVRDGGRK